MGGEHTHKEKWQKAKPGEYYGHLWRMDPVCTCIRSARAKIRTGVFFSLCLRCGWNGTTLAAILSFEFEIGKSGY